MSDETIQYITTDYLIEVDGGEQAPAPIEYIVELGQVGVQGIPGEKGEPGFSPTVGYILNDNTFRINITNQDGVTQTPNLYDYFASQSDLNGYLKVDGSNASNDITVNGHTFESLYGGLNTKLTMTGSPAYIQAPILVLKSTEQNGKVYYGSSNPSKELATIGDIPTVSDATITLTQGGVTKGTFTLNGSATTIDLDAGGGTITNPLEIESSNGNKVLSLGIDEDDANNPFFMSCDLVSPMGTFSIPVHLITSSTSPITLTKSSGGTTTIGLDYNTNTLGLDADNKLTVIGGGGGSYTAGTGIDITGGVISIDTSVVAQLSDIPDTSDMATQTWVGNQGYVTTSDLSTTLADYVLSSSLATVATTGSYSDLSNKPTIPTNSDYVDLTTDQTIGGNKTFSNATTYGANIVFDGSSNSQALTSIINNVQKNLISRNNSASMVYVGNTSDALNLRGSGARPTYYTSGTSKDIALYSDIPSLTNYVTNTDYADTSNAGVVKVDGTTITIDANGVISASSSGGLQNTATGTSSLTIFGTACTDNYSINIGDSSTATRSNSVAIGNSANTISQYSVAIGYNAKAGTSSDSSNGAVAIGYNAGGDYSKGNTIAIGNNAVAKSTGSIAIGNNAEVGNTNYTNGIAIGESSQVYGANSINLGYGANVTDNTLSVGFYGQNSNTPYTLLDGTTGLIPEARIGTFANSITSTAINPLINKLTNTDITVAPSSDIDTGLLFKDVNDNTLAGFVTTRFTNGTQATGITATNEISGTNKVAYANVYVDGSGDDHFDASAGAKKSIAQMFVNFGTSYTISFDASGNFTPTANGFLQVSVTSVGSGSIGYLATAGLNVSMGHDISGYVATGIIPVQAGVVCHIDLFGGAYVSSATFIPNGRV